MLSNSG